MLHMKKITKLLQKEKITKMFHMLKIAKMLHMKKITNSLTCEKTTKWHVKNAPNTVQCFLRAVPSLHNHGSITRHVPVAGYSSRLRKKGLATAYLPVNGKRRRSASAGKAAGFCGCHTSRLRQAEKVRNSGEAAGGVKDEDSAVLEGHCFRAHVWSMVWQLCSVAVAAQFFFSFSGSGKILFKMWRSGAKI